MGRLVDYLVALLVRNLVINYYQHHFFILNFDDKEILLIAASPTYHERVKHIEIDCDLKGRWWHRSIFTKFHRMLFKMYVQCLLFGAGWSVYLIVLLIYDYPNFYSSLFLLFNFLLSVFIYNHVLCDSGHKKKIVKSKGLTFHFCQQEVVLIYPVSFLCIKHFSFRILTLIILIEMFLFFYFQR